MKKILHNISDIKPKYFKYFIIMLITIFFSNNAVAEKWPVKDFEIYQGKPGFIDNYDQANIKRILGHISVDLDEPSQNAPSIPIAKKLELEAYLGAVARHYEAMGFLPPKLEPVVTRADGTKAFRIYCYDYPDANLSQAAYEHQMKFINIDLIRNHKARTLDKNFNVTVKGYQDLAHELFHAVQYAYPLFYSEHIGHWVSEGTADAVGLEMARKLRGKNQTKNPLRWGLRRYHTPLYIQNDPKDKTLKSEAYQTSSLWAYLGEKYALRGKDPSIGFTVPDYSYLHDFFSIDLLNKPSENEEYLWLDSLLKYSEPKYFTSLYQTYPKFIATFAEHFHRFQPSGSDIQKAKDYWIKEVFGECKSITLDASGQSIELDLKKVTSKCFQVKKTGHESVSLNIQTTHRNRKLLEQLSIYMSDGTITAIPLISKDKPPYIATWNFKLTGDETKTFIVSNIAKDPGKTKDHSYTFHFYAYDWQSNMTSVPPTPAPKSKARRKNAPPLTNKEKLDQFGKDALKNPTLHLEKTSKISFQDKKNCNKYEKQVNICGPKMKILLGLNPYSHSIPGANKIEGAVNFFQQDAKEIYTNPTKFVQQMFLPSVKKIKSFSKSQDATGITITIPKIKYGFVGTFKNAKMKVSKAQKDHEYIAYGATRKFSTHIPNYYASVRPDTAIVKIDEFSPLVLRGSFRADLVDTSNPGKPEAPIIAHTIRGDFLIPSPWIATPKSKSTRNEISTEVAEKVFSQMGFTPEVINSMQSLVEERKKSERESAAVQCSCECTLMKKERDLDPCVTYCAEKWKKCQPANEKIPDDTEAQIAYLKKILTEKKIPPFIQENFVKSFHKVPQTQRKLFLEKMKGR